MAKTIVHLDDRYRLRAYDKRNWVLEEYREADPSHKHHTKDASAKWRSCDTYFQSIGSALRWVIEHKLLDDGGEYELLGVIERVEEIADGLGAEVVA